MKRQKGNGHERPQYKVMLGAAVLLALVGSGSASDPRVEMLEAPIPDESMTPFLAGSSSVLHLSWLEKTAEGHRLRYGSWDGVRFSSPTTIHSSDRFFANWADFSSVVPFGDGRLAAHWLSKAASGTYEYDVDVSVSDDGGKTWSPGMKPHRDGTLSEHGFVSLVPSGKDGFEIVWLDGRNFAKDAEDHDMVLMHAGFDGARFGEETLLDPRVCECCQTSMAGIEGGFFVAYRDRSPEEIRDISFVRYAGAQWSEPRTLEADGWHLTGCPVNGPQVAASGNHLALAWFTASKDDPRVQVVFSRDGGATFGEPVRVSESPQPERSASRGARAVGVGPHGTEKSSPLGRIDVELVGSDAVVSWLLSAEGRGGEVLARRVSPGGTRSALIHVARTGTDRASGFPRMASFQGTIYIAWTESLSRQGPSRVRFGRLVLE